MVWSIQCGRRGNTHIWSDNLQLPYTSKLELTCDQITSNFFTNTVVIMGEMFIMVDMVITFEMVIMVERVIMVVMVIMVAIVVMVTNAIMVKWSSWSP